MDQPQDELYQERILDHFERPYHRGHCPAATHAHEDDNPLCGDVVRVELDIHDDRICQAWFSGCGCCISQAAASMLMQTVEGKSPAEIQQFTGEDMLRLFGARLTPNRQKCCLLSWRVLQSALFSPTVAKSGSGNSPSPQQLSTTAPTAVERRAVEALDAEGGGEGVR